MASGIVIIDKLSGWTSMDVCAKIRGILKEKRVGHGGTLDPMATGVLPVFVGQATRAVEFAENGEKEYIAGLRLGLVTNTQDTSGDVLEQHPAEDITRGQLEAVLARFTGEIQQVPPMYSAIKIGGQKLYELARKGQEIERPARTVTIHGLELLEPEQGAQAQTTPENQAQLDGLTAMTTALASCGLMEGMTSIDVSSKTEIVMVYDGRLTVKVLNNVDFDRKLKAFKQVIGEEGRGTINMKGQDKIIWSKEN